MSDVLSFYRSVVRNRCDGLIILQAENVATSESPFPGNRKRGWPTEYGTSDFLSFTGRWAGRTIQSSDRKENNRCDRLIRLQTRNLATGESPLASRQSLEIAKEDEDRAIPDIQFSELYIPGRVWRMSFRFVIMAKCHR
jgi:hypothetical protein